MNKLLIFVLVMLAIYWIRRRLSAPASKGGERAATGKAKRRGEPEKMLACAHCGVHVPESEGVRGEHDFFCCAEHRRQHRSQH